MKKLIIATILSFNSLAVSWKVKIINHDDSYKDYLVPESKKTFFIPKSAFRCSMGEVTEKSVGGRPYQKRFIDCFAGGYKSSTALGCQVSTFDRESANLHLVDQKGRYIIIVASCENG